MSFQGRRVQAADLHQALTHGWRDALIALGIGEEFLANRHGPCPTCGGKDRFRWDNRNGRGTWICNHCGSGDGFRLLMGVNGWSFPEALRAVAAYLGMADGEQPERRAAPPVERTPPKPATATARVRDLLRTCCRAEDAPDVIAYLRSRNVWPLPKGTQLRGHVGVDYFERLHEGGKAYQHVARLPALIAPMVDQGGELVTAHVTYVENGAKFARQRFDGTTYDARKILSPIGDRIGVACRLMPIDGETLAVAEGIETALSASAMHDGIPTWACMNTALLGRFTPPDGVRRVLVFADRDTAGLEAVLKLKAHLDGRCDVDYALPPSPHADWNDAHRGRLQ